ncbi:glycoside hydrolase family 31 protein [Xylanibacter brevis]|uniref:glycoside hydrolase family 31 protein n=1 Tax=Xylanibacter brevis TaxID=83231 RepID=UPI0009DEFCD0|nr:TIM-barrel domain-containing protein [Xylanibacter brevis]
MKLNNLLLTLSVVLIGQSTITAQSAYQFVPADYVSTDNNRAPQSAFSYDEQSFTVHASGQNNVAFKMGGDCDGKYFITPAEHWFVVSGRQLKTGTADAYLWWLNGTNHGSQVAPDHVCTTADERTVFVWNLRNGNPLFSWFDVNRERMVLNSNGTGFILAMGLTATGSDGTVTDVDYYSDMAVVTAYPELMQVLGITHESLAQQMRQQLTDAITAANELLTSRPADETVKNQLRDAITAAQQVCDGITTSNYATVGEDVATLQQAMEQYRANSRQVSCQYTADGMLAGWDDMSIRIRFVNDSIVRITKFVGDESRVEPSLVVKSPADAPVAFTHTETDGIVTLSTSKVRLTYHLGDAVVTVYRATGEQLFTELAANITAQADGPNDACLLKQTFRLADDEQIYGLGQLQNGRLSMRGLSTTMIQDNRSIHIPYIYSSKRYALYWDNYSPTTFTDDAAGTMFSSTGQAIDYYVLVGSTSDEVLHAWRQMTGSTQLPPLWNFGLYQSKQRYQSTQEVIDVVKKYRELRVPLDCVVQDWQYWGDDNHWNAMEFLNPKYSDYQRMIDEVHGMNAKLMISVWANFGPGTRQYQEFQQAGRLIPIQSYPTTVATRPYDVYDAATRDSYWNYLSTGIMSKGVDALWLDSSEPDDFSNKGTDYDYVTGLAGRTFRSLRNAFPLCHVEGVYDHHLADPTLSNKRVSILTRSAFAGMQRTGAFVWSADITSSWQTLAAQIPAACNFSVSGLPYWNSDTGAFFTGSYGGVGDPAWRSLYDRWTQFSCFCPMMRFHGDNTPREIWQFGSQDDAQGDYNNILRYIRLRYRLLPYLYSTAHQVVKNDDTFMRGMALAYEDDAQCVGLTDQYMFGRSFLVAPIVTDGAAGRNVYLPQFPTATADRGLWYDFWTGATHAGGKTLFRTAPQDILPLYIPAGTILPFGPEVQYSNEKSWDDLEIRIYAGADGRFTLYEDELDGYGYKQGACSEIPFTWNEAAQTLTIGARQGEFPGMLKQRTFRLVRVSSQKGFGDQPAATYDQEVSYDGQQLVVSLKDTVETETIPEDVTSLIVNPSFEADGKTLNMVAPQGWTVSSETTWWGVNTGGGNGDPQATDGQYIFGVWDGAATKTPTISQTLTTLPKGNYTLTVDMQASNRSNETVRLGMQHVFAGNQKGYFARQISTAGCGDVYPMQTISVDFEQPEDGLPVTIGVSTEGAPAETWFKIDNFRLYRRPGMPSTSGIEVAHQKPICSTDQSFYGLNGQKLPVSSRHRIVVSQQKKFLLK